MSHWTKYELDLAAWLCRLAYSKDAQALEAALKTQGWTLADVIRNSDTDTNGYLARDVMGNMALVFPGTTSWTNVRTDLNAEPESGLGATVHEGFWKAYKSVAKQVQVAIERNPVMFIRPNPFPQSAVRGGAISLLIVGHSLGAAIATLAALDLSYTQFAQNIGLITFGAPRVGFRDFADQFSERMGQRYVRVVYQADFIPQVPMSPYKHIGGLLHINAAGREVGAIRRGITTAWYWLRSFFKLGIGLTKDGCPPEHHIHLYQNAIKMMDANWSRDHE